MNRLLGAILVILSTSYIGYEYSKNIQKRIQQLESLRRIVTDLFSDVEYGACTLFESFSRIGAKQDILFQGFLEKVCSGMQNTNGYTDGSGMPFSVIFAEAITSELCNSALTKEDKNSLEQLGKQLGNNQKKGQLRILHLYLQELEGKLVELEKTKKEKQKMGQMFGVTSGILIVILLL